jgi:antitoxin MazE
MKVAKWGNSLAVRLPAGLVEALELKEGDDVEIDIAGRRQLDFRRKPDRQALLAR